jgi:hypothetical protein
LRFDDRGAVNWLIDQMTLKRLYALLFAALIVVMLLWQLNESEWVQTWAPNVGAELAGALVTVAAIDLIVTRQRRPLRQAARRGIDAAMLDLIEFAITQRARESRVVGQSDDVSAVLNAWKQNLEAGRLPSRAWLKAWNRILTRAESRLGVVRDRYESVLSERMLAALDDLMLWSVSAAKRKLPRRRGGDSALRRWLRRGASVSLVATRALR